MMRKSRVSNILGPSFPDPSLMPDPVYLVFGSSPSDISYPDIHRTFYNNPHYYLMDISEQDPGKDISRYFLINLTNPEPGFIARYANKFQTVIFDYSVMQFIGRENRRQLINNLLAILVPNGTIIIDSSKPMQYGIPKVIMNFARRGQIEEYDELMSNYKIRVHQEYLESFSDFTIKFRSYAEILEEYPESRPIYGPLMGARISIESTAIVIKKSEQLAAGGAAAGAGGLGGGRRSSRARFSANRRTRKRRGRKNRTKK